MMSSFTPNLKAIQIRIGTFLVTCEVSVNCGARLVGPLLTILRKGIAV